MSDILGTNIDNGSFTNVETTKISNTNNALEQEVNDLCEFLKLEHNKYVQYKILYDVLEECVGESSDLNGTLKSKVANILLSGSVSQSLSLDTYMCNESSATVFGLCDINREELNYSESSQLQEVLKLKLDHKYRNTCHEFHKITNNDIDKMCGTTQIDIPLQMAHEDKVLIEFKNKLIFEQEQYVNNLLNLLELLNEITNLRLKKLPQVTTQKIKECQVEGKINNLKSLLAQEKVRIDVFTETSNSLKAYKELIKDIKEQQRDCEKEVQELRDLKEKYNEVSCTQYDDILKSYLQYKSSIEKKKLLYSCLKN